jgi:phosphate:Na+ symporter
MDVLMLTLQIMGSLGVFLFGLKVMSEGLQKAAGSKLRAILSKATDNRLVGTVSGFLVTCAVQSSSATTVMVVAFCSAGLLTLGQSLGVIFGANIGTTTTAWIVSLLGFKVKIASFALPLIGIGFFSQFIQRWRTPHRIGQALVGFGLLFLGLALLKDAIPDVKSAPQVMEWIRRLEPDSIRGLIAAMLFGTVITIIVQSSSASMAITLTAAAKGYIDFPTACAIALGQNIGTTTTAVLAAIGAPITAKRAALAHFLFNVIGSIWPILIFGPFLEFTDRMVPGNPYGTGEDALLGALPTHIAAFHTTFNVVNTLIFLPFVPQFQRLIEFIMPERDPEDEIRHDLVYLTVPFGSTPELVLPAAQREVDRMAGVTLKMIDRIQRALQSTGSEQRRLLDKIRSDELATDVLEHQIHEYLSELVHEQLSSAASKETLSLMSMTNDLERIGDHGEKISMLLARVDEGKLDLTEEGRAELLEMAGATRDNLEAMRELILHRKPDPIPAAEQREERLNELRNQYRQSQLQRMIDGECDAVTGVIFTDLLTSFEKMGDHAFNVIEATAGIK